MLEWNCNVIDLDGKVAIVTGATSGIGKATALTLARAGAAVIVTGRREKAAKDLVGIIQSEGLQGDFLLGDVVDPELSTRAVAVAQSQFGRLDILANVAGAITRGDATETSDEEWASMLAINVSGTFYMSRAAIPAMRNAGGGSIVNLASNVGLVGCTKLAAYCASKGAVVNLTRAMALDHAHENIRVNSVNPGAVDTPMLVFGHGDRTADEVRRTNCEAIPQGWLPTPGDIANAIAFLASDLSRHITGVALPVDGGATAQ